MWSQQFDAIACFVKKKYFIRMRMIIGQFEPTVYGKANECERIRQLFPIYVQIPSKIVNSVFHPKC